MSGPDENVERAEDKTNDVGANPRLGAFNG
jgi:hypothetical protein